MRSKATGWMVFVGCLLLLSFAATTRYSQTADLALICIRLALIVALSILVLRERWNHHRSPERSRLRAESGEPTTILQRMRGWYYDQR